MMKALLWVSSVALVVGVVACGGSSNPTTSPTDGSATPNASADATAPGVRATFDGKPVALVAFDAYSLSEDEIELVFSTHPECGRESSLKCPKDQSVVKLRVANTIAGDGKRAWMIVTAGVNSSLDGAKAPVSFEGDAKSKLTITVPKLVIHEQDLVIEGKVVATGHEIKKPEGTPQPDGKLSIAGVPMPVQSAYVERGASGDTLYLYGGVMYSCHSGDGAIAQPASVMITVDKSGAPDVRVDGNLVLTETSTSTEGKPRNAKITVGAEKDGKFPVTADVDYFAYGLPIKASGTFQANRCE